MRLWLFRLHSDQRPRLSPYDRHAFEEITCKAFPLPTAPPRQWEALILSMPVFLLWGARNSCRKDDPSLLGHGPKNCHRYTLSRRWQGFAAPFDVFTHSSSLPKAPGHLKRRRSLRLVESKVECPGQRLLVLEGRVWGEMERGGRGVELRLRPFGFRYGFFFLGHPYVSPRSAIWV